MSKQDGHARRMAVLLGATILGTGYASAALAQAAAADVGEVVVTGSRIVRNGNESPTPLTTVALETLQQTTPSNVPDALNKLPVFIGSRSQRTTGGSTINWPGNFLNLRRVGTNRTLILLDGMRVPATDASANVDTNTLPQGLMERVDVVTGGASAVYGSDAVTGVVNFILNKNFNGLEAFAQTGTSWMKDNDSWKAGVIAGAPLFDGRGHVEFSYEHYNSDGVDNMMTRPLGPLVYMELGGGTAANPYRRVANMRNTNLTPGGFIGAGPLKDMTFISDGVLAPFAHGLPGNGVNEIGGGGGYAGQAYFLFPGVDANPWLAASLQTDQAFGRFDYDLTDSVHAFVQASVTRSENFNVSFVKNFTARYATDNAFLPENARALLVAGGAANFSMAKAFHNRRGDVSHGLTNARVFSAGLDGKLTDNFNWELHYTNGQSKLHERSPDSFNMQRVYAALDAVVNPANGQVVCRVSLTPASAALYPGCQPFNAFGPSAESDGAYQYVTDDTEYFITNRMDDVAGSVSGTLFEGWAGPIQAAVSGEYRKVSLRTKSAFSPVARVDCTGQNPLTCDPARAIWNGVVGNLPRVSENVAEAAVEVEIPLLKDLPLVKRLDVNAAGRYTKYSISGATQTWKLGGVWEVTDDLKVRGTRSRDIRAPNLNDLFAPQGANFTAFTDFLTGVSGQTTTSSRGNPDLEPEVATTTTAGLIYTPGWAPGLSFSIDWYNIKIVDVITSINGGNATVQQICIASGGTSQFCSLVDRPFPITNTTPANFPTMIRSQPLNSGYLKTRGVDFELGYGLDLETLQQTVPGRLDARLLFSYQPTFKSFTGITGAVITNQAGAQGANGTSLPDKRATLNVAYSHGPLSISVQERWHGATRNSDNPTFVYAEDKLPGAWNTDLSIRYKFEVDEHEMETFVSVENLLDRKPEPFIGTGRTGAEGYAYPASFDEDVIGRYVTVGIRAKL